MGAPNKQQTWHSMPMWVCPACQREQQQDDYGALHTGSSVMCQFCETEFTVMATDATLDVLLSADQIQKE